MTSTASQPPTLPLQIFCPNCGHGLYAAIGAWTACPTCGQAMVLHRSGPSHPPQVLLGPPVQRHANVAPARRTGDVFFPAFIVASSVALGVMIWLMESAPLGYAFAYAGIGIVYLLPALTAAVRGHHNKSAILALNVLLGWTAIGWIAAMVWAGTAVRHRSSP